jgi:hypothetical protein
MIVCKLEYAQVTHCMLFLGAFAKLQTETISFFVPACPSVPPSVRNNLSLTDGFYEIWYLIMLQNPAEKVQIYVKYGMNNRYFT